MSPYRLSRYLAAIDEEIRSQLVADDPRLESFYEMMRYHLGLEGARRSGGKRLRPLVCLLLYEGLTGDFAPALPAAAALELLHNFTLIHDDIEDQDATRRHRPTVWARWGVAQAINAGDGMYALSRLAVRRLRERGIDDGRTLAAVEVLDRACVLVCEGQHLDITFEGRTDVRRDDYLAMIARKTGALLRASAELPARLAGAAAEALAASRTFGEHFGVAFQAHDDLQGIWGATAETGKAEMNDIAKRKMTLPLVVAGERASPQQRADLAARYSGAAPLSGDDARAVRAILDALEARAEVKRLFAQQRAAALGALSQVTLREEPATLLRRLVAEATGA